jgi:hypothetical protein
LPPTGRPATGAFPPGLKVEIFLELQYHTSLMASVFVDNPVSQKQASPAGGSFVLPAAISLQSLLLLPLSGEII